MLVGINLLREGLDMPEVSLVAILDADKEGFLRSDNSLIQTIGRAARNINGRAILYADTITGSMKRALDETDRRRARQVAFNEEHGITPRGIQKAVTDIMEGARDSGDSDELGPRAAGKGKGRRDGAAPPTCSRRTSSARSRSSKARCSRRPATSSSRRRRACATRSSG